MRSPCRKGRCIMNQDIRRRRRFQGLRVAITGGTSGLGLALVRAAAAEGALVAFVARDAARVAHTVQMVPGTHGFAGDVGRKDDIYPLATAIAGALGGLDVLI